MLSQFSQARPGGPADSLLPAADAFPALVALLCTEEAVYLSGPASLWKMDLHGGEPQYLTAVPVPWPYREAARWRLLRRLGRLDVRELIRVPAGGFWVFRKSR